MSKIKTNRLEPRATNGSLTIGNPESYTTFEGDVQVPGYATQEWVEGIITGDIQVELGGYMPKSGDTFTGDVKHKKDIIIEPKLPNRFVNIRNRYATNADGSSAGSGGEGFGVNFDLDHGNSGYNTVQWTTRNGNVFSVYGGTQANAKYEGEITDGRHLVNKKYVDENTTVSLNCGSGAHWSKDNLSESTLEGYRYFGIEVAGSSSSSIGLGNVLYLNKLVDSEGVLQRMDKYTPTDNSYCEVYSGNELYFKSQLKPSTYKVADRNPNHIVCDFSTNYPLVSKSGGNWSGSSTYNLILTGMKINN